MSGKLILNQLGGTNRLVAMIGAKYFVVNDGGNGKPVSAQFRFAAKSPAKINSIVITLNALDLYDITYWRIRGTSMIEVASDTNIYGEDLKSVIEHRIQLRLSL